LNKHRIIRLSGIHFQTALLILLGGGIAALGVWLRQAREEDTYPIYWVAILWILVLIFCLWLGNLWIYRLVSRKYSWETSFNKRFFLQLLLTVLFSLGCINGTYVIFKNTFTKLPPDPNQMLLLNIYGTLFLIPVLSIQFGLLFLQKWKKATVEQEKLQKEQAQSELMTIKSHLSPHFLFNNLNILSSLIHQDNYQAQDYLDRFAEVYRYVLKNRELERIDLAEELQFLESYRFLLQQRFSNGLRIQINVSDYIQRFQLPPLSLQMVLENALKHNKLSEENPLTIRIYTRVDPSPILLVENNLQIRPLPDEEKTGFGLENIRRRYWLIARKEIIVNQTATHFQIILPLLSK